MTSPTELTLQRDAQQLAAHAHIFYQHGWLMGTSGNLSARQSQESFLITASGKDKGALTQDDFLLCDLEGRPLDPSSPLRPSAETLIHCEIYRTYPHVGAIYHTHDPYAALCSSRDHLAGHTAITDVEMIKGLDMWEDGATIQIPILPNPADLKLLAQHVREHLAQRQAEADLYHVPCVNISRHGVYAWGKDTSEAKRHMESLAYLFLYSWQWGLWAR